MPVAETISLISAIVGGLGSLFGEGGIWGPADTLGPEGEAFQRVAYKAGMQELLQQMLGLPPKFGYVSTQTPEQQALTTQLFSELMPGVNRETEARQMWINHSTPLWQQAGRTDEWIASNIENEWNTNQVDIIRRYEGGEFGTPSPTPSLGFESVSQPTYAPLQLAGADTRMQALDRLLGISPDEEAAAIDRLAAPALRRFEEEILPMIRTPLAGTGNFWNPGRREQELEAGAALTQDLAALGEDYRMQRREQALGAAGQGLSEALGGVTTGLDLFGKELSPFMQSQQLGATATESRWGTMLQLLQQTLADYYSLGAGSPAQMAAEKAQAILGVIGIVPESAEESAALEAWIMWSMPRWENAGYDLYNMEANIIDLIRGEYLSSREDIIRRYEGGEFLNPWPPTETVTVPPRETGGEVPPYLGDDEVPNAPPPTPQPPTPQPPTPPTEPPPPPPSPPSEYSAARAPWIGFSTPLWQEAGRSPEWISSNIESEWGSSAADIFRRWRGGEFNRQAPPPSTPPPTTPDVSGAAHAAWTKYSVPLWRQSGQSEEWITENARQEWASSSSDIIRRYLAGDFG